MTTASTTNVISNANSAAFQAWYNEFTTALFTSIGITQTADTGQIGATAALPGTTQTSAGYVIGRFNDTAQATSPVFFKIEFGTGASVSVPMAWITVGQGSNGSGTLTGTLSARVPFLQQSVPLSTTTSYPSRFCWNATNGFLGVVFKIGAFTTNAAQGGFMLFRDNNASGAATTTSVTLIANQSTAAASSSSFGAVQSYNYANNVWLTLPSSTATAALWTFFPYALTTTTVGGQVQVAPAIFATPVLYVSANLCIGLITEIPVGNTVTMALVGSTSLTFLAVGIPFGGSQGVGNPGNTTSTGLLMLWQ
jgi:hypothetical protein